MCGFSARFPFVLPVPLANARFGGFLAENFANLTDLALISICQHCELLTLRAGGGFGRTARVLVGWVTPHNRHNLRL